MVDAIFLHLQSTEGVDVGGVTFHFSQLKTDARLADHPFLVGSHDPGFLFKMSAAAAPTGPDTEFEKINRHLGSWHHIHHTDQGLHAIHFLTHVFAENAALAIGSHCVHHDESYWEMGGDVIGKIYRRLPRGSG